MIVLNTATVQWLNSRQDGNVSRCQSKPGVASKYLGPAKFGHSVKLQTGKHQGGRVGKKLFNISTASHRCCADKRWSFANTSVWTIVQAVNTNYDRRWSNEAFGSHKKFIGCSRTFASQSLSSLTSTEFGSGSKRAPSHMSFSRMQMQTDRSRQESSLMLFERRIESLILTQR